jgi:hypothetical protein
MQWCIAYAAQARWETVPEELRRLIRDTFSGWIQSRVNEKANKVWRDLGNRANASGLVGKTALWEKLTDANVLGGEFDRDEVVDDGIDAHGDQPSSVDMTELCADPKKRVKMCDGDKPDLEAELESVVKENEWLSRFDKITNDSGKFLNPESEQKLVAELRLFRLLNKKKWWHKVNDAWLTSLLPDGGLIWVKSLNRHLWVLKTNECAALCWPAEQQEPNMWRKAKGVKKLTWYTCFDLDDVEVLSVQVESPKSLFLQERLRTLLLFGL